MFICLSIYWCTNHEHWSIDVENMVKQHITFFHEWVDLVALFCFCCEILVHHYQNTSLKNIFYLEDALKLFRQLT